MQKKMKINLPEIRAIKLTLLRFWDLIRKNPVLTRTDNILLKAYINKQGGSESLTLHIETAQITWCSEWNPESISEHLGQQNVLVKLAVETTGEQQ